MKTIQQPVFFEGQRYFGIKEFDCSIVHLFTEKTLQGTFMTVIPISNAEYRENNPTKAAIEITEENGWTIFYIYSDWGQKYTMKIHNILFKEIEDAKKGAIALALPSIK